MGNRKKQLHRSHVARVNYAQQGSMDDDRDDGVSTTSFFLRYFRGMLCVIYPTENKKQPKLFI
jgi:hypothetical protein